MYNKVGKPLCELNNYFILTSELRVNSWHRLKHLSSLWGPAAVNSKAAVLLLLIHCCRYLTLLVGFYVVSLFYFALLYVLWLFFTQPRSGLQCVIVVFCDRTHLHF